MPPPQPDPVPHPIEKVPEPVKEIYVPHQQITPPPIIQEAPVQPAVPKVSKPAPEEEKDSDSGKKHKS